MDEEIKELKNKINQLQERLNAIEKEQRLIREDILSGEPQERMKKRILEKKSINKNVLKKKLDEDFRVEI